MTNAKRAHRSKTVAFNVIGAAALLWPRSVAWVAAHPVATLLSIYGANIVLRLVTKDRVSLEIPNLFKRFIKVRRVP